MGAGRIKGCFYMPIISTCWGMILLPIRRRIFGLIEFFGKWGTWQRATPVFDEKFCSLVVIVFQQSPKKYIFNIPA